MGGGAHKSWCVIARACYNGGDKAFGKRVEPGITVKTERCQGCWAEGGRMQKQPQRTALPILSSSLPFVLSASHFPALSKLWGVYRGWRRAGVHLLSQIEDAAPLGLASFCFPHLPGNKPPLKCLVGMRSGWQGLSLCEEHGQCAVEEASSPEARGSGKGRPLSDFLSFQILAVM